MASIIIIAALILSRSISARSIESFKHTNGFCKQLNIPVFATSESAIYDIPRVNSDRDTTNWAIHVDKWSTPKALASIVSNTTTSGTYNIHAQLCVPKSSHNDKKILQIATHGVSYAMEYWDPKLDHENLSFVEAALEEGYSILTYDRLGVGLSDIPDAYDVVQAPLELEILHQLTLMARNGTLYSFASKTKPANKAFNNLAPPTKIVHVGHSFGSFLTSAFIAKYGSLSDGAIITGFLVNSHLGERGMSSFHAEYAATANPPFNRPSGYIVSQKSGIQTIFFAGDENAYSQEMLDYGDAIKQPVPVGEFASAYTIVGLPGPGFTAPVQYLLAEFDFYVCGGDCKGLADMDVLRAIYPNAAAIEVAIQPNTGHGLTLHNNATAGYQLSFDFLARHGL